MGVQATVVTITPEAQWADGLQLPAHSVKVKLEGGAVKWLMPDELKEMIKPAFHVGIKVEVWSNSQQKWVEAEVSKINSVEELAGEEAVPVGSIKVTLGNGAMKWVLPEEIT